MEIHQIVKELLKNEKNPVVLEIGARAGEDTVELAKIPNSEVHAFEPLPVNYQKLWNNTKNLHNVDVYDLAISDSHGFADFYVSDDPEHFQGSSSLLKPTGHLEHFTHVCFNEVIKVPTCTLDQFCEQHGISEIAFQYWDTQGNSANIIKGGQKALSFTKYLYTEAYTVSMYDGEPTRDELIKMLPNWEILQVWPTDILLRNTAI